MKISIFSQMFCLHMKIYFVKLKFAGQDSSLINILIDGKNKMLGHDNKPCTFN